MPSRKQRAGIACDTLKIIEEGFYCSRKGSKVYIDNLLKFSISSSILYKPEMFKEIFLQRDEILKNKKSGTKTTFEVSDETTLSAGKRIIVDEKYDKALCLNFASAKNPGGGFLNGSQAQEESLARASGLYPCISQMQTMYQTNKKVKTSLYTDNMIYSPKVPIFRDDNDSLLDVPYTLSIITAPAVNVGAIHVNEHNNILKIEETMINRLEKILSIAVVHNYEVIILGAWGCGVFKNNPDDVAYYFSKHLKNDGKFNNFFRKVIFAIFDRTKDKSIYNAFKKVF